MRIRRGLGEPAGARQRGGCGQRRPVPARPAGRDARGPVATREAPPGARPVDVVGFEAAVGGGVETDGERVRGLAWIVSEWLDWLGLDARSSASGAN